MSTSSINKGGQILTFDYRSLASSKLFNRSYSDLLPYGVYAGGRLTRVSDTSVGIDPLVCLIQSNEILDANISVRIETTTTQEVSVAASVGSLYCSTAKPYVVLRFGWADVEANYMDILAVAYSNASDETDPEKIWPTDIVLGKIQFQEVTAGNWIIRTTNIFDYTRRAEVFIPSQSSVFNEYAVSTCETNVRKVHVSSGVVNTSKGQFVSTGGDYPTAAVISDTAGMGRVDLVYVDDVGSIRIEEGVPDANPVAPLYMNRRVLAEIHRGPNRTSIEGTDIVIINDPGRQGTVSAEDFPIRDVLNYFATDTVEAALAQVHKEFIDHFASPTFTGAPIVPDIVSGSTNTSQIANAKFVHTAITYDRPWEATAANIKMNGAQSVGVLGTVARADHVHPIDTTRAPLNSPTLTGNPMITTTPATGDNTHLIADTAFVSLEINNDRPYSAANPLMDGVAAQGSASNVSRSDHVHPSDTTRVKRIVAKCVSVGNIAGSYASNVFTAGSNYVVTIDGVTVALNDRVLLAGQSTGLQNGVYYVSQVGTASVPLILTRTTDADSAADLEFGMFVQLTNGTIFGNSMWALANSSTITLGTTALVFDRVGNAPWETSTSNIKMNSAVSVGTLETVARADHVHPIDTSRAPLNSPTFTGTPALTTSPAGTDNSTALASTATAHAIFTNDIGLLREASTANIKMNGAVSVGTLNTFARADHVHPIDTTRAPTLNPTFTGTTTFSALTASYVPYLNASKQLVDSTVTSLEFDYVHGLTSAVQTQLNGKSPTAGNTSLTTVGTITTGVWNATDIPLSAGGTNASLTAVPGAVAYCGASAIGFTAAGAAKQALTSAGAGTPVWATLDLTYLPDAAFKKSVRCATTTNLAATYSANVLTMSAVGVVTLDGIAVALNDRVLIKDQSSSAHNGVYTVTTLGTASVAAVFTRAPDANVIGYVAGSIVNVDSGAVNGGLLFSNNLKTTDALGTTGMLWYKVLSSVDASTTINGTVILRDANGNFTAYGKASVGYIYMPSAVASRVPYFDANKELVTSPVTSTELGYLDGVTSAIQTQINGKSPTAGNTGLTTVGTIGTGTWAATDVALAHGGTNASLTASNGAIVYSNASAFALSAVGASGNFLVSNGAAAPSWRNLSASDVPTLNQNTTGTAASVTSATQNSITSCPNLATVGTISSGTWSATNIALGKGGTGAALTGVQGGIVYSGASSLGITAAGTSKQALTSAGTGVPVWATLDLTYLPDAAFKKSVKCATTANLAATYSNNVLTMSAVGVIALDGVTPVLNDRILIKNQTTSQHNGIYTITTLGTASVAAVFTRAPDANAIGYVAGSIVNVDSGTANGGILFSNNLKTTDTLGTTAMAWYQVYSSANASSSNTANTMVLRDASGNFSAGKATLSAALISGLTASTVVVADASKNLVSSAVTSTELGYLDGVTSAIQTQFDVLNDFRNWDSTRTYALNDPVFYQGVPYRALQASNLNHTPSTSPTYWEITGGGSGDGNVGYEYKNGQFEAGVTSYVIYKDAAAVTPADGTGQTGTPAITFASNTTTPLNGTTDAILTKTAGASRQGEGVSYDFTIDRGQTVSPCKITFNYKTTNTTGTYADGDLRVYIFDITNATLMHPSVENVPATNGGVGQFICLFNPSTSLSYRLCFHVAASDTTKAWKFEVDNIQVGQMNVTVGAAIGNYKTITPQYKADGSSQPTGGTIAKNTLSWRRSGESMEGTITYAHATPGTAGNGTYYLDIPEGLTADVSALNIGYDYALSTRIGTGILYSSDSGIYQCDVILLTNNRIGFVVQNVISSGVLWSYSTYPFAISWLYMSVNFKIPKIAQWTSNVNLASDFTEYASNSDVTQTAQVTASGFLNGFGNWGGFGNWPVGTTWVRRVRFTQPIQWGRDELSIVLRSGATGEVWSDALMSPHIGSRCAQGANSYGCYLAPVVGDNTLVDFVMLPGGRLTTHGTYGANGAGFVDFNGSFWWMIKKVSNGNMAEIPSIIKASYQGTTAQALTGEVTTIVNFNNKVEDSHTAVTTGASWKFTAPIAGRYIVAGEVMTAPTAYSTGVHLVVSLLKNGNSLKTLSWINGAAMTVYEAAHFSAAIDLVAGDYISISSRPTPTTTLSADGLYNWIDITWVGK